MVCSVSFQRGTRGFWYGTLRKRKQKRDVQLDHLCAPIFVFYTRKIQFLICRSATKNPMALTRKTT